MSRSKEEGTDMEEKQEAKKVRRKFTPEQKFEILKDIERCRTIKEGLARHQLSDSLYRNVQFFSNETKSRNLVSRYFWPSSFAF